MSAEHWPRVKVSELCDLIVDCVNKTAPSVENETPYKMIRTPNIKNGKIDLAGCRYVEKETYEKWTRRATVDKGDVLLTREAPMGEVGLVNFEDTVFLGQRIMQYRANPKKLDSNYLLYAFLSPNLQYQFRKHDSTGSIVSHIRVPDCSELEISTPPLGMQKKISKVLRDIDDKIELNNRINAELEAMAKTLYDYWFVQFDFPDANGKPYKTSGGKMVYNETLKRKIPLGWEVAPIAKYFNYQEGPGITKEKYANEGHNFINIKCIKDNDLDVATASKIADKFVDAYSHFQLDENDIVLSTSGTLGRLAIVRKVHLPLLLNTSVIRFKAREFYYFEYLYCYLQSQIFIGYLNQLATGSIQKNFGPTHLAQIFETFPSENLMIEFSKLTGPILKKIISLRSETDELIKLRDWLLPMLMNGQVTVTSPTQSKAKQA